MQAQLQAEPLVDMFEYGSPVRREWEEERDSLSGSDHGEVHDYEGNLNE